MVKKLAAATTAAAAKDVTPKKKKPTVAATPVAIDDGAGIRIAVKLPLATRDWFYARAKSLGIPASGLMALILDQYADAARAQKNVLDRAGALGIQVAAPDKLTL
ncbi:hypothetical protein AGMMS49959_18380 [Planctomycetales bacterium]|nr:hypothetical protein AGMMS49959_18380 [Planctomycetales bacterium]